MQHLSIFPILIPLLCGALMLLPPFSKTLQRQRILSVIGTFALLIRRLFYCIK